MDELVADAARFDVFRLVDAAMNGQGAQVSRMLAGLRAEGEAVPGLLGMVVMELQRAASLARVQARGGNLRGRVQGAAHLGFEAGRVQARVGATCGAALGCASSPRPAASIASRRAACAWARPGDAWLALERLLLAVAEPRATRLLAG